MLEGTLKCSPNSSWENVLLFYFFLFLRGQTKVVKKKQSLKYVEPEANLWKITLISSCNITNRKFSNHKWLVKIVKIEAFLLGIRTWWCNMYNYMLIVLKGIALIKYVRITASVRHKSAIESRVGRITKWSPQISFNYKIGKLF